MINENSGYDIKYQQNKVHNLKLAAATFHGLVIRPGQTFSFWRCARQADKKEPYKDGLILRDGKIVGEYGGGLGSFLESHLSSLRFLLIHSLTGFRQISLPLRSCAGSCQFLII